MTKLALRIALPAVVTALFTQPLTADDDAAKAQTIVDRAIKAMGGPKALAKTRNSIVEDDGLYFGMGNGLPYQGRYVFHYGESSQYRMDILGVFITVFDGEKGWMSAMGNTMALEGQALDQAKRDSLANYAMSLIPLEKPNKDFKLSLAEAASIDGEECDGIQVNHENMATVTIHFSRDTGLIKRTRNTTRPAEQGFQEVVDEAVFSEFKGIDGVRTATKVVIFRDGKKFVESSYKSISYPDSIDDKEFQKPE